MAIATVPSNTSSKPKKPGTPAATFITYALVIFGGLVTAAPLYFMFVFSTQPKENIFRLPPPMFFGSSLIHNYQALMAMTEGGFWRIFWNSVYLAGMATITQVFFCALAGFAFAMYTFKFRDALFRVLLATMAIPGALNLIPFYLVISFIGWIGQPRALWFPGMAGAFGIFLMRQYIQSAIPSELVEAARIDGCSEFGIFWRIILPLARPALATLGLVTFIGMWNEFVLSSIFFRSRETYTLQTMIRAISGGTTSTNVDFGGVMMGTAISVLPLLIIFVFTSRQLIAGLTAGSVKN
jgi:multiple sugar transport system permease protein